MKLAVILIISGNLEQFLKNNREEKLDIRGAKTWKRKIKKLWYFKTIFVSEIVLALRMIKNVKINT